MSIRKLPDGTIEADTGEELAEYERLTGSVSVKLVTRPILPDEYIVLSVTREPDPTGTLVEEPCNVVFDRKAPVSTTGFKYPPAESAPAQRAPLLLHLSRRLQTAMGIAKALVERGEVLTLADAIDHVSQHSNDGPFTPDELATLKAECTEDSIK